jgi:hypothetical protein
MEDEHERLADELEQEADSIQRPSTELKQDIKDTRDDWEQKTKAEAVPGAMEIDEDPVEEVENQPNTFEYEERTPETAEAAGPSAAGSDGDSEDDADSGSDDS